MEDMPRLIEVAPESKLISSTAAQCEGARLFSTVSLNLAKTSDPDKVVDAIRRSQPLRDADLYLFQEVRNTDGQPSVAEQTARKLERAVFFETPAPNVYDQGLAILSRYPITNTSTIRLKACELRFRSRNRFAMTATVQTPSGDLRAWNVHLDTRINPQERLEQLQPVVVEAGRYGGPQLIGGDFNTNGMYWIGNILPLPCGLAHGVAVRRKLKEHGFHSPLPDGINTFPPLRRHLDWIFLSELASVEAGVVPVSFSDHNAIWVRALLRNGT
jgi:endonuclease/exonuclease/phosphatase family metal-dependent hydrolase